MRLSALVVFGLLLYCASPGARADSVLVGTSISVGATAVESNQFIAQPFVLGTGSTVSAIDVVFIANDPNNIFTIELTNGLGSGANVLAQTTFVNADAFNPPELTFALPVNQTLAAGTYYIVASGPIGNPGAGWIDGTTPNIGTVSSELIAISGGTNNSFPPASDWILSGNETQAFQVIGHVPEPATLSLLGFGLAALGFKRRRLA